VKSILIQPASIVNGLPDCLIAWRVCAYILTMRSQPTIRGTR